MIVADEPTGSLDSQSQENVLEIFKELAEAGKTVIIVTHNPEVADYADVVIKMKDGEVVETIERELDRLSRVPDLGDAQRSNPATGEILLAIEKSGVDSPKIKKLVKPLKEKEGRKNPFFDEKLDQFRKTLEQKTGYHFAVSSGKNGTVRYYINGERAQ